ncbi:MAG: glycerophosphodiester phosphodiesterase [Cytophagales bacterium]|nr:glycerophosphodiester phosphodiesterase [Cytophagales bacterium]
MAGTNQSILLTAHRGASAYAPENTLAAIRKALELKAERIEIDVHLTKDFVAVLLHDRTLDRTTDGSGSVENYTYQELLQFSAGKKFSDAFRDEKIPTLEEAIRTVAGQSSLVIEIKAAGKNTPIEKTVVELLVKHNALSWCIVQSFRESTLLKIHHADPRVRLHKLFVGKIPFLPYIFDGSPVIRPLRKYHFVEEFSVFHVFATPGLVEGIHRMRKKVNVWTVNDKKTVLKCIRQGIDGVITNYPDILDQ